MTSLVVFTISYPSININDYSGEHDIDPAYPVKYECHAVHVPLAELDTICDPRFIPGSEEFIAHAASLPAPFHRLCLIRSTRQLESITLDVLRGKPHLTVIRNPCTLMFKPLDGGPVSTLTLNRFPEFQRYVSYIVASPQSLILKLRRNIAFSLSVTYPRKTRLSSSASLMPLQRGANTRWFLWSSILFLITSPVVQ